MIIRADLHIHGRYSMATSKKMVPPTIVSQARLKGLNLVGSGDAFHGAWLDLLEKTTEEVNTGFYSIKEDYKNHSDDAIATSSNIDPLLVLTAEVEDNKRIHHLIFIPSLETASEMRKKLDGNLESDGRPRLRMDGAQIQEIANEFNCIIGPSHAFTPWTGIYKAYNSVYDCYPEKPDFIELGLSANTDMADRIEELQEFPFLTNSDAHSPWPHRLGREFNEIEIKSMDFLSLQSSLSQKKIAFNYGFDPRMGKYHYTACSRCYRQFSAQEVLKRKMKCPCGGIIKKGVDFRIEELSSWQEPHHPPHRPPYIHILPLAEIISLVYKKGVTTIFVQKIWKEMIEKFGDEISVLIQAPLDEIMDIDPEMAEVIKKFRNNTLQIRPGGGGRYGEIIIEDEQTLDSYF
jgi:uncharacterized protein (TIGR00375 family)